MILVLKKDTSPRQEVRLNAYLEGLGLTSTRQLCQGKTILLPDEFADLSRRVAAVRRSAEL